MRNLVLGVSWVVLVVILGAQQPQIIYSNTSPGGNLAGSIAKINAAGSGADPFAQGAVPTFGSETFGVPADMMVFDEGGTKFMLWWENNIKKLIKAADVNGNGVLDPVEFTTAWSGSNLPGSNVSATSMSAAGTKILISNNTGNAQRGLIVLEDLNGDGDYQDAGESLEVLNSGTGGPGATRTVNGVAIKTDQIDSALIFPDGQTAVFKDQVGQVWYKLNIFTNDIQPFLNFNNTLSAEAAAIPLAAALAGLALPGTNSGGGLNVIDSQFNGQLDVFYFTTKNSTGDSRIFIGKDLNGDCDLNDPGEIGVFSGFGIVTLEDIAVMKSFTGAGSSSLVSANFDEVFVMVENGISGANTTTVFRCVDFNQDNDADDPGEVMAVATLPTSQDPQVGGMVVLPPDTFDSGCVRFGVVNTVVRTVGGTMRFSMRDIPSNHFGVGDFGLVALSLALPGNTLVAPGCRLGLVPDALTMSLLAIDPYPFTFGPITSPFAVTALFAYPAGLPVGFVIPFAALIFGPGGLSVSNTSQIVVNP